MTEPATPTDHILTGEDVLRWYMASSVHVGAAAEAMASDLAAAWAEVEEVRGKLEASRRIVAGNVSRGYARAAMPLLRSKN